MESIPSYKENNYVIINIPELGSPGRQDNESVTYLSSYKCLHLLHLGLPAMRRRQFLIVILG